MCTVQVIWLKRPWLDQLQSFNKKFDSYKTILYNQITSRINLYNYVNCYHLYLSFILLLIASNFLCKYKYESQLHFSLYRNTITDTITINYKFTHSNFDSMLLPPCNKEIIKIMDLRGIILFIVLIQAVKMEIEQCANSMWTQSVINNCYTGQMEHVEGCTRLALQMTLQKPYIFVSHCQCHPSESEQLMLWHNLTSHLLPNLEILDENIKTLSMQFNGIRQSLEWKQTSDSDAAFRQSKNNLHEINKLHRRFMWVDI